MVFACDHGSRLSTRGVEAVFDAKTTAKQQRCVPPRLLISLATEVSSRGHATVIFGVDLNEGTGIWGRHGHLFHPIQCWGCTRSDSNDLGMGRTTPVLFLPTVNTSQQNLLPTQKHRWYDQKHQKQGDRMHRREKETVVSPRYALRVAMLKHSFLRLFSYDTRILVFQVNFVCRN